MAAVVGILDKKNGAGYKPNSVQSWSFHWNAGHPAPLATYPKTSGGQPYPQNVPQRHFLRDVFLFGLAPDGVYPALTVTCAGGELLPRHFTLTESEDPAVYFLWHFPPVTRRSCYEPSCPAEFGLSSQALKTRAIMHPLQLFI